MNRDKKPLSYREAGVDIDKADRLVDRMSRLVQGTWTEGTASDFGGFAAAFTPRWKDYEDPRLLACTDGVGTKLRLLGQTGRFETAGRDCAAMVLNDLVAAGARPLFFLDYIAAAKLEEDAVLGIVEGLAAACRQADCALIGGETAEMPDYYSPGDHEVVGFAVGIADGAREIPPVSSGDVLIGLPASGPHSNGFSLIRRILEESAWSLDSRFEGMETELGDCILAPTPIYAPAVLPLFDEGIAKASAHITGGGLPGNLPRILPGGLEPMIDWTSWRRPRLYELFSEYGNVSEEELRRTFNLGVGMVVAVAPDDVGRAISVTRSGGYPGWPLGEVVRARGRGN